jgi:hypothetical protein
VEGAYGHDVHPPLLQRSHLTVESLLTFLPQDEDLPHADALWPRFLASRSLVRSPRCPGGLHLGFLCATAAEGEKEER